MINILPYSYKKDVNRLRRLRVFTVTIWAITILALIAVLLWFPLLVTINSRFAIANKQIAELERTGVVVSPVNVALLEERAKTLADKLATDLPPAPTQYVALIQSVPHSGITLSGFVVGATSALSIEVTGVAATREALQRFIAALEANEIVTAVESPVSNYVKSVQSPFSITVILTQT